MRLELGIQEKVRLVTMSPRLQGSTTAITIRTQLVLRVRVVKGLAQSSCYLNAIPIQFIGRF